MLTCYYSGDEDTISTAILPNCSGDEDVFGDASHGKARTKQGPSMDQARTLKRNGRTLPCLLVCL